MSTFSVTDRMTFRRCRRQWDYSSNARRNLTRVGAGAEALELGGLIHRALAEWILNPEENLKLLFLKNTQARIDEIRLSYLESVGASISEEELNPIYDVMKLGMTMMENYQTKYKKPIPDHMTFASAEQEIIVPVPGTEHTCANAIHGASSVIFTDFPICKECNDTGVVYHYLSATLDGLLQNQRGLLYVLEHKTYGQRPRLEELMRADQFTGYCWVVSQLNIGKVAGVAYDGMWKREKPSRGNTFDDLFLRKELYKTPEQIEAWGVQLAKEINEMADNPQIYPNIPWNGCGYDCSFVALCDMELAGESPGKLIKMNYVQRKVVRVQGIRDEH